MSSKCHADKQRSLPTYLLAENLASTLINSVHGDALEFLYFSLVISKVHDNYVVWNDYYRMKEQAPG